MWLSNVSLATWLQFVPASLLVTSNTAGNSLSSALVDVSESARTSAAGCPARRERRAHGEQRVQELPGGQLRARPGECRVIGAQPRRREIDHELGVQRRHELVGAEHDDASGLERLDQPGQAGLSPISTTPGANPARLAASG